MFGYLRIHCLGTGRVRHREVLIQQLLGDDILETKEIKECDDQRGIDACANQYQW